MNSYLVQHFLDRSVPRKPRLVRRGQGAQYDRNFLCSQSTRHCVPGKLLPVGGELHNSVQRLTAKFRSSAKALA
jgi:hypothetical protein